MKYLFKAVMNDGTEFNQDPEDRHPAGTGSSFTHLLEEEKLHGGISVFALIGEGHEYAVHLTDGHFAIDSVPFGAHDQFITPQDLRLIYFREVSHHMHGGSITSTDMRFFIGWQFTDEEGKNQQQTIFMT
jgi:hypothetical protein